MSIKHLLTSALSIALIGLPSFVAAAPVSGDLIKASGPSVYYFGANQKRYVFPSEKTYLSWYSDFSTVQTVSDAELASYPLGGNVTYRPGTRLVKITTDPKVYAVAANGTLRWVQTEEIARVLFGTTWAQRVDDIQDAFFVNYRIGTPIAAAQDYSPTLEQQSALNINVDKTLIVTTPTTTTPTTPATSTTPVPPTSTPPTSTTPSAYTASAVITTMTPSPGESVGFQATVTPSSGLDSIKIFFDGVAQKTCSFNPCATELLIPFSGVKSTYDIRLEASWITGQQFSSTSTLQIATNGGSAGITLTIPRPEIKPQTNREAIVTVDPSFSARFIDIYLDGNNVRGCLDTQECRYSELETSPTGTIHSLYTIVTDHNGQTRRSATSTLEVVDNVRPLVQVSVGRTFIRTDETVDITVQATDDDGIQLTEIWLDGVALKQCHTVSCTIVAGPWNQPRSLSFIGRALDIQGLDSRGTSTTVTVQ